MATIQWISFSLDYIDKDILLRGKCFWAIKATADSSWNWRKTLKLSASFWFMLKYKVENGKKNFIWYDNWHSKGPLVLAYNPRVIYDSGLPLHTKLSIVIRVVEWCWPPARSDQLLELQRCLCDRIYPRDVSVIEFILWSAKKGFNGYLLNPSLFI